MAASTYFDTVQKLYIAYYQRPADPGGLLHWSQRLDAAGGNVEAIIDAFANSPESQALYGTIDSNTIGDVVDQIYQALFGRPAEPEGRELYVNHFKNGELTPGNIAWAILKGAQNDDLVAVQNKLEVANLFTEAVDGRPMTDPDFGVGSNFAATYVGNDDADTARAFLASVTSAPSTVKTKSEVIQEIQNNIADPGDPILPFTLTKGTDTITGTEGNDTIDGAVTGLTSTNTLNAGDKIDGGAGVDTLKVQQSTNFTGFTGEGFLKNVEVLEITNTSTLSRSFDAKGVTGLETVKINANNANYTLTNLAAAGVAVEVAGMDDDTLNVGFATDVTKGEADALSVKVTDVGAAKTTTAAQKEAKVVAVGIENLTIEAAGTANFVDLSGVDATGTAEQTLTIKGAGALTVTAVDGALVSVDAAAATGKLDLDLSSATVINSVKAGSGDDIVTVKDLKVDAQLAGGAGNDVLVLKGTGTGTTTTTIMQPEMSGFETLQIQGLSGDVTFAAGTTADLSKLVVKDGLDSGDFTLAELDAGTFTIELAQTKGGTYSSGKDVTYTSASDLTVSTINEDSAATSKAGINDNVVASAATALTVNVGKQTDLAGTVTAAAATSVNVNVAKDAALTGDITAAKAANVNLSFDSDVTGDLVFAAATDITLTATAAQAALVLNAPKAQALTINSSKDVTLAATSDLESLANLTLQGIGGFDATTNNVEIGAKAASVTVNAANAKSDVNVEIGDYAANGGQVVFTGSTLAANTLTIGTGRNEVAVTGGIADDTVTYNTVLTSSDEASININLGSVSTNDKLVLATDDHDWTNASVTLSGVDVISGSGATLTLNSSVLSGQAIKLDGVDVTLKGSDAADTIDASKLTPNDAETITIEGGKGNDTIKLGAATETVKFAAAAVDNGVDTISGFTQGTGGDVLKIDAFLDATAMNVTLTANPDTASDATNDVNLLVDIAGGQDITTAAGLTAALAEGGEYYNINMNSNGKAVFVTAASSDAGVDQYVFFATSDDAGNITVDLVGVIKAGDIDSFVAANFNIA